MQNVTVYTGQQKSQRHEVVAHPCVVISTHESFYLVDVIQVGSLIGPVVVALLHPALDKRRQHYNHHAAVLPDHLQTKQMMDYLWQSNFLKDS